MTSLKCPSCRCRSRSVRNASLEDCSEMPVGRKYLSSDQRRVRSRIRSLCRHSPPGTMLALAAWRNCHDGAVAQGWKQHDAAAGYHIMRTELLRPLVQDVPASVLHSALRVLTVDVPLKVRIAFMVAGIIRRERSTSFASVSSFRAAGSAGLQSRSSIAGSSTISTARKSPRLCRLFSHGRRRRHYLARADAVVAVSEFTKAGPHPDHGRPARQDRANPLTVSIRTHSIPAPRIRNCCGALAQPGSA